ncbi:bacterio-opsin activator domain-containing protein [Halopiger xanaduensis]|uniref:Putative PAS/PAC sensor protein n=1 Tax=Halopiger xanaduensis (strain DSM 18323 / JCM 14033 / SH-6) TaxID=797210 RepID=F8D4L2_HALXS|nr:bacterio-opsin activator domain-containing protein [Halopiger xanaduensis]AEH36340.1 putative PAS/PAC sensor protein [Halopiger xanaduensis SH-6]
MTNADPAAGADGASPAATALERVVAPVVAVVDGTIAYANGAARDAFGIDPESGACEPSTLASWPSLEAAIEETVVGTVRTVALEDAEYDARVHRDEDGATIVFESTAESETVADPAGDLADPEPTSPATSDRAVKERALEEAPVGITISDPDREDNPLVYVNEAYQEITGYSYDEVVGRNCRFLQGGDSNPDAIAEMAAAIDEDRPVTVELENYRKDGTEFWNEVTIAPVRNDAGEVTNYVGFQNDVTARKEAERALERRTEELEYVLDRVEGLVRDVTASVAGSTDRGDLEAAVCERIAEESAYDGVWIGERNPATGTIDVRSRVDAGASAADGPVDRDADSIPADGDHPAAAALSSDDVAVGTVDGASLAAFPLRYNEIEYGVLTVRLADGTDVDERESAILSALARAIASGINARETSRVLATDAVVAVELEVRDRQVAPVALSADADCRLEYRRSVHRTGETSDGDGQERTTSLFTVTGASAAELTDAAAELPNVDCRIVVERENGCLIELERDDDLVGWLSERGVRTRAIEAEDGRASVTLELPRSANVRSIVEGLEDRYEGTDVRSFQQRDRSGDTRQEFAGRLEDDLTERQLDALRRAYLGGYFEWPRPTTGEELAQSMDVSRPTFHEHLRTAEAKLCRAFFDDAGANESA